MGRKDSLIKYYEFCCYQFNSEQGQNILDEDSMFDIIMYMINIDYNYFLDIIRCIGEDEFGQSIKRCGYSFLFLVREYLILSIGKRKFYILLAFMQSPVVQMISSKINVKTLLTSLSALI